MGLNSLLLLLAFMQSYWAAPIKTLDEFKEFFKTSFIRKEMGYLKEMDSGVEQKKRTFAPGIRMSS